MWWGILFSTIFADDINVWAYSFSTPIYVSLMNKIEKHQVFVSKSKTLMDYCLTNKNVGSRFESALETILNLRIIRVSLKEFLKCSLSTKFL